MQNSTSEKKPLLRVSNLKQYFPLKKKGLYVRANDGITLDIYTNGFAYFRMGYACAESWVMLLIMAAVTGIIFKTSSYWTFYEN